MAREYEKYGIYQNTDENEHGVLFEYKGYYNTMYISSVYIRNDEGKIVHGGFNEHTFDDLDPTVTGFVLSDNTHSGGSIDHAPDVIEPMIDMGLIPDGIDVVVGMDRRGSKLFAAMLLEDCIEKGSKVLWDGSGEIDAVYPTSSFYFKKTDDFSWQGDVVYKGAVDERHAASYISAILTASAELCRETYELMQKGISLIPKCVCETEGEYLARAVDVISLGRASFPAEAKCTYYDAVARALDDRRVEMAHKCPEVASAIKNALFICACAKIWDETNAIANRKGGTNVIKTDRQIKNIARRMGIEPMIEALEKGVPVEDIIA